MTVLGWKVCRPGLLGEGEGKGQSYPGCLALLRRGLRGAADNACVGVDSLEPGARAGMCQLLCPVLRASRRVLAMIFYAIKRHDQNNIRDVE